MSHGAMLCPRCLTPAPPRIAVHPAPIIERFHCDVCDLTTLREELIRDTRMSILRGGPAPDSRSPGFQLLQTLRPSGVLGDQSDSTVETVSLADGASPFTGEVLSPNFSAWDGVGTIDYVRLFVRATFSRQDVGPQAPILSIGTKDTVTEESQNRDVGFVGAHEGAATDFFYDFSESPAAEPWNASTISTMSGLALFATYGEGTQVTIDFTVFEIWAELWGVIA